MNKEPAKSPYITPADEFMDSLLEPDERAALDADLQEMARRRRDAADYAAMVILH